MIRIVIFIILFLCIDMYVYKGLSQLVSNHMMSKKTLGLIYWGVSLVILAAITITLFNFGSITKKWPHAFVFIAGTIVVVYFPKLIFAATHFLDDIAYFTKVIFKKVASGDTEGISRRHFITTIGLGASSLLFGSLIYGVIKGKFNFRVMEDEVLSNKIPKAFDGTKIVQISDAHLGSFMNAFEPVQKAIDLINSLDADYVVFTGDMVNNNANEALPWVEIFKGIKAKKGKYSIFGNHDYADYGGQSKEDKIASIKLLKEIQRNMGFHLLEDESVVLKEGDEEMTLIGVHNWGHGFHQHGDLQKAMGGVNPDHFKILLSHDPTHFDYQVKGKTDIDLTLSGHTHGMQMGIEIPNLGIQWSPIKLRYKKWGGMYNEDGQRLYVNRGLGVLAYPGRVGISPEITLLTLKSV